ncbi:MAG: hypothetical protein JXA94_05415 [Parachlamydiales bacterium]|nr:hypothetical protein [Parachlamydiales bacterium]
MASTKSFQNFFQENPREFITFDSSGNIQKINNLVLSFFLCNSSELPVDDNKIFRTVTKKNYT